MLKITNIKYKENGNWFNSNLMTSIDNVQKKFTWKNLQEVRKYIKYLLLLNRNKKDYYIEVINGKKSIVYRYNANKKTITLIKKI